jgi:hypothetical protein
VSWLSVQLEVPQQLLSSCLPRLAEVSRRFTVLAEDGLSRFTWTELGERLGLCIEVLLLSLTY